MATDVDQWVEALVREARRDLVFLWHIEQGRFGGPSQRPNEQQVRLAIHGLLVEGCAVGFGQPGSAGWRTPEQLNVPREELAERIISLRRAQPEEFEFLAFGGPRAPSEGQA